MKYESMKKILIFSFLIILLFLGLGFSFQTNLLGFRDFLTQKKITTISIPTLTQPQESETASFTSFPEGASFGTDTFLVIDGDGNLSTTGTLVTEDLEVGGTAYLDTLAITDGLYVAGNQIIDSSGRIPGLTVDYFTSLDGSALTNVNAHHLGGVAASSFIRSDQSDEANAAITFNAVPGSANVGGGPLYINPGSTPGGGYTLLGAAVNGSEKFRLDASGNISLAGTITGTINPSFTTGSVIFQDSSSLSQDNISFFWDNANDRLGLGTNSPGARLDIAGDATSSGTLSFRGPTDPKMNILNGENFVIRTSVGGDIGLVEKFTILNDGKVGIGTTNPQNVLHVVNGSSPRMRFGFTATTTTFGEFGVDGGRVFILTPADTIPIEFWAGGSPKMSILTNGLVGIGTTAPESRLQVTGGGLCVGSDANCNTDNNTEGVVYSSATAMTVYDVAENYPTKDTSLVPGEVVELSPTQAVFVQRANGPTNRVLGIISTEPAVLLGGFNGRDFKGEFQVAVALSGRVPVRMDPGSPSISIGDLVTASSTPGYATKASGSNWVLGRALENWNPGQGKETVVVFVSTSYYSETPNLALDPLFLQNNQPLPEKVNYEGLTTFTDIVVTGNLDVGTLKLTNNSLDAVGTLHLQPLALGDVEFLGGRLTMNKEGNIVLKVQGGIQLETQGKERPECNKETGGTQWFTQGESNNSKDSFEICARDEAGNYQWRVIY
jgi:hypothetical protein